MNRFEIHRLNIGKKLDVDAELHIASLSKVFVPSKLSGHELMFSVILSPRFLGRIPFDKITYASTSAAAVIVSAAFCLLTFKLLLQSNSIVAAVET